MIRLCTTCAKIDVYLMCCVIILPNDKNVITNSVCLSTFVIKYYNEINFKDAQNQTFTFICKKCLASKFQYGIIIDKPGLLPTRSANSSPFGY